MCRRLLNNALGDDGWCAVFEALRDNKGAKIESWDLSLEGIGPKVAKALAEYLSVSSAVKSLKCVCLPKCLLFCQRPLTRKRTLALSAYKEAPRVCFLVSAP